MEGPARPVLPSVLLINGLVDILLAFMLIGFPLLGIGLPGLADPDPAERFLASGWGLATLVLGLARLWSWRKVEHRTFMGVMALLEGLLLATLCVVSLVLKTATLLQALLPALVGLGFAIAYALCFTVWRKGRRPKEAKPAPQPTTPAPQPVAPMPPPVSPSYTSVAPTHTSLTPVTPASPQPTQPPPPPPAAGGQPPLIPLN